METNITWHAASVSKEERRKQNKNHSFVLWFTGLSASGKSTVANAVARKLFEKNIGNYVLDGDNIRHGFNKDLGFSVFVKCPIEECEKRDPKGLYKRARSGEIKQFTGIDSPYEEPIQAEIIVETHRYSIEECAQQIIAYLQKRSFIPH